MTDDMIHQSKVMQEWRLNMYGKPICPSCLQNVGVDAWWNLQNDDNGNLGDVSRKGGQHRQRIWACMVCQEFVVIKPVNEAAGTGLVPGYEPWLPDQNSVALNRRYEKLQKALLREPREQQDVEMAGT